MLNGRSTNDWTTSILSKKLLQQQQNPSLISRIYLLNEVYMKVHVTIPILNPPEEFFTSVLPSLEKQSFSHSLLLINSGATIPEGNYDLKNIDKKEFNHANTRNIALGNEADFYLFMTQDAIAVDEHLVAELIRAFDDPEVVVAYARQMPKSDADPIERFARETNYPPQPRVKSKEDLSKLGIKTFFNSDSCAMYRGKYFRQVGGFTKDLNTNEDMEFAARAIMEGKKVAYCANAQVWHSHQFTLKQIWNRYVEIGQFFGIHKWILDTVAQYSKAESTGIKQAVLEILFLIKTAPAYMFRSIIISGIKFVAFKYGIFYSNRV